MEGGIISFKKFGMVRVKCTIMHEKQINLITEQEARGITKTNAIMYYK